MKSSIMKASSVDQCPPVVSAVSVADLLRQRSRLQADEPVFAFHGFDWEDDLLMDYRQLDERANVLAMRLREQGLRHGERVLLVYPSARDFLPAFFACLYAGCVAVPVHFPEDDKEQRRLAGILLDSKPSIVMCRTSDQPQLEANLAGLGHFTLRCLDTTGPSIDPVKPIDISAIGPDDVAFLQYTSGSTSAPKGVMVSHGNLLHNLAVIQERIGSREGRCLLLSWLPHFHDMGLIGGLLHAVYCGRPIILFSTVSFLQQPMRWLRMISDYRVTHSVGPNFAYELCLKRSKRINLEELDLSCWRMAFSGAEPVRSEVLLQFAERFAPTGFCLDSFLPGYGLAECTVMATAKRHDQPVMMRDVDYRGITEGECRPAVHGERMVTLTSSGNARQQELLNIFICEQESGLPLADGKIGEICISGKSVCQGYFGQPEISHETFNAYTEHFGNSGVLRTGDLGFLDEAGELFVTGRLKDVVICNGANHYPQDLELVIEQADARVREGRVAVFNLNVEGRDGVFAVCEIGNQNASNDEWDIQGSGLIESVRQGCGVLLTGVIMVRKGCVPRTSSGKIQRGECRNRLLRGELQILHEKYSPGWAEGVEQLRRMAEGALVSSSLVI